MYTLGGTFEEASAWLQGFASGLNESTPNIAAEWYSFADWLKSRLGYPSNWMWCSALRRSYPDDAVAFEQLRLLFAEYKALDATAEESSNTLSD